MANVLYVLPVLDVLPVLYVLPMLDVLQVLFYINYLTYFSLDVLLIYARLSLLFDFDS